MLLRLADGERERERDDCQRQIYRQTGRGTGTTEKWMNSAAGAGRGAAGYNPGLPPPGVYFFVLIYTYTPWIIIFRHGGLRFPRSSCFTCSCSPSSREIRVPGVSKVLSFPIPAAAGHPHC